MQGGLAQELNQFIHFKNPEYAAGFALTIPIRNRSAQADNARAGLHERQAEISLQETHNQIGVDVRTAIIGLMQAKAQVRRRAKPWTTAGKAWMPSRKKWSSESPHPTT